MITIVGGIIKKGNKVLLVQEANESCTGMWNIPAGKVEEKEYLIDAAIREIYEETGINTKLSGIVQIGNKTLNNKTMVSIIFSAEAEKIIENWHTDEILQTKFFTIEEIKSIHNKVRSYDLLISAVEKTLNNEIYPIDLIKESR